jgi:salicylate hydroxylase
MANMRTGDLGAARVIIIGGGIGGLAAAVALQRRGFAVQVYERTTELREIGAGVIIQPNGRRVLVDLGLDDLLAARSSCMASMYTCHYATGDVLQRVENADMARHYGLPLLAVHRADLHDVLLTAVRASDPDAVRAGHDFVALEQDADRATVRFANGASDHADAVIGADGISSSVRSFLFPDELATFNGQVAFRALVPDELVPASAQERELAMHRAPGRYLLHYPLRGGTIMNLIGCGQTGSWEAEGWSIPASNDEFAAAYADFAPDLLQLIRNVPDGALFKWGLRDRAPLEQWTLGRVAMLGDAAHPMTPFLGQGACMALEDALVLGRAFAASSTVEEALERYEVLRRPRGNGVQMLSLEEGRSLQDPTLERKGAAGFGLLEYDAATVPV